MLPLERPDRIQIAFDDHRLANNAGLLLPATLAQRVGLRELVDRHLDLGDAPGWANAGDKLLTLVASALAGGDCIDDADALRAGRTSSVLGCMVKASSTPRFREGRLYGLTETVTGPRPLIRGAGPKVGHRTWATVGSPVAPPGAWPHATPSADTVSRSIPRRHPRTPGRSAAWNR